MTPGGLGGNVNGNLAVAKRKKIMLIEYAENAEYSGV